MASEAYLLEYKEVRHPNEDWKYRVRVTGPGFHNIGLPLVARIGDVDIEGIIVDELQDSFTGYLTRLPKSGDELFIGYGSAGVATGVKLPGKRKFVS